MGRAIILALLGLCACTTTEEATADRLAAWRGRPVDEFVARLSWPPAHVMSGAPGQRTYIFRKAWAGGGCGATLWARSQGGVYVIERSQSDCGPAAF